MRRDGLCHLANGKPLPMAYRKEYRMLTDDERRRFHAAMNELKRQGIYRFFATQHRRVATGGAHSGPAFLPWHREFVKRFEIALRLIDPTLAMPYWDSVMDNYLPDPQDSIFFSPLFVGDTDPNGFVVNGPFAYWRTLEGRSTILRDLGKDAQLFTERQLAAVAAERNIWNVLSYTVPFRGCPIPANFDALEYSYTNIHFWVGGDLATPELSEK
uniref:Tyrosinase_Cu-bd domain-containing protein n=1 Tax=Globodera pallida TaxID=36090 RepID=A0A183CFJ5_GLOPA